LYCGIKRPYVNISPLAGGLLKVLNVDIQVQRHGVIRDMPGARLWATPIISAGLGGFPISWKNRYTGEKQLEKLWDLNTKIYRGAI